MRERKDRTNHENDRSEIEGLKSELNDERSRDGHVCRDRNSNAESMFFFRYEDEIVMKAGHSEQSIDDMHFVPACLH
jgi:hypothetical protein